MDKLYNFNDSNFTQLRTELVLDKSSILQIISDLDEEYQIVYLVGFPCDIGAHNCENRTG